MKQKALTHLFVEYIPDRIQEGVLYISIQYGTAAHACCCGCGKEVVTPFSPTDWRLGFDGESVSLHPSIGNWSFPCRSHYFIQRNKVVWAAKMSQKAIEAGRMYDRGAKARQYASKMKVEESELTLESKPDFPNTQKPTLYVRFLAKLRSWWSL